MPQSELLALDFTPLRKLGNQIESLSAAQDRIERLKQEKTEIESELAHLVAGREQELSEAAA